MIRGMLPSETMRRLVFDPETAESFRRAEAVVSTHQGQTIKLAWVSLARALRDALASRRLHTAPAP